MRYSHVVGLQTSSQPFFKGFGSEGDKLSELANLLTRGVQQISFERVNIHRRNFDEIEVETHPGVWSTTLQHDFALAEQAHGLTREGAFEKDGFYSVGDSRSQRL